MEAEWSLVRSNTRRSKSVPQSVCLSVSLSVSQFVCLAVYLSVCLCVCQSVYLFASLSVALSVSLPVCLTVGVLKLADLRLFVCLSVVLSVLSNGVRSKTRRSMSVCQYVCLSIRVSLCLRKTERERGCQPLSHSDRESGLKMEEEV